MFARIRNRLKAGADAGFTLIELLIVIIILGVLAGIVVFSVGAISDRGETAACETDLKTVQTASEAYRAQNASYAANMDALVPGYMQEKPTTVSYTAGNPPTIAPAGDCD
jgi:general secretion pathway protein G